MDYIVVIERYVGGEYFQEEVIRTENIEEARKECRKLAGDYKQHENVWVFINDGEE